MHGITAGCAHVRRSHMRTACPRGKVSVLHAFSWLRLLSLRQFVKSSVSKSSHALRHSPLVVSHLLTPLLPATCVARPPRGVILRLLNHRAILLPYIFSPSRPSSCGYGDRRRRLLHARAARVHQRDTQRRDRRHARQGSPIAATYRVLPVLPCHSLCITIPCHSLDKNV